LRSFLVDISPLRSSRQYRLLFSGQVISLLGRQLTVVAAPVQVFQMTDSTLAVGLLGLAQFPALVIGSLIGGSLGDALDRRRLLLTTQLLMAATTAGLGINAMMDQPSVAAVFVLTSANAAFSGIDSPSRSAMLPRLVGRDLLPAAFSLQILMFQSANAAGPLLAGLIIADWSLAAAFWLDSITFLVAFIFVFRMLPMKPEGGGTKAGVRSIVDGLKFVASKEQLRGAFVIDINAMVFGMPRALFPEMGLSTFGGTASTVGLLYAAPAAGALLMGLTSGWVGRIRLAGRATVWAVVAWGLAIAAFGFTTSLVLALVFLAIAGGADAVSAVFRNTIVQLSTPDRLRGRISSVQMAVVAGGPRLGDAEAGIVGSAFSPRVAAWTGGFASAIGALIVGAALPIFRSFDTKDNADPEAGSSS